ncbi:MULTISPECIES: metallophosphoesterase [Salinibaculum]|uniref:metallophosphoesterase n=1 Tax=Salinibaculum TaxID=2732368 RepID=UPI0030D2AEDC
MFDDRPTAPVESPVRDGVAALAAGSADPPTIVSISDVHGYLEEARSALLTLADHDDYDPVVTADAAGRLQWAGNDYVLVFNGDLVDRGPHNAAVVEMVRRLLEQAPDGRVRVTLGNHEMGIMMPHRFGWDGCYSTDRTNQERRGFLDRIADGHVVAAYEGHNVTFAHAGRPDPYEAATLNDALVSAARTLREAVGSADDATVQQELIDGYPAVLGLGGRTGRGPGAGVAWLDFEYMPADAPPQVVGHTRQDNPRRREAVVCQNVIRNNHRTGGGEAVVVETPECVVALGRAADGTVMTHEFSMPDATDPVE